MEGTRKCFELNMRGSFYFFEPRLSGAPDTIRTCDLLIRSQIFYPAELRARGDSNCS